MNKIPTTKKFNTPWVRGYVDPATGDYYLWNASETIHFVFAQTLGLEYSYKNRCDIILSKSDGTIRIDCEFLSDLIDLSINLRYLNDKIKHKFSDNDLINEQMIAEGNRLYSAVRLDEIPKKYKSLKLLGRGTTAVALEKNNESVLLFTRDRMKVDWLTLSWGIEIGKVIETFESRLHPIQSLRDMTIYVIEMPKLFKLDTENKRIVNKILKEFEEMRTKAIYTRRDNNNLNIMRELDKITTEYEGKFEQEHYLKKLSDFVQMYDPRQFSFDMRIRNFMQTVDRKIVVLDPIVDSAILDIHNDETQKKLSARRFA